MEYRSARTGSFWLLLSVVMFVGIPIAETHAQQITLRVADSYPPTHIFPTHGTRPWMKRIEELTNGHVKFQYYPAEQLGKINDLPTLLRRNVTDIALVAVGLMPGDFPLASVGAMPGTAATAVEATRAYWSLVRVEGPLRKEFQDKQMRPLAYFGLPQYEIIAGKKQIVSLADLKGLKIRAGGGLQQQLLQALGASPVQLPTPEIYTSIERSTIDGVMIPFPSARSYKLEEVAKYGTANASLGSTIVGYAISDSAWQKLPESVRAAIDKASQEFMERIATYQDQTNLSDKQYLTGKGMRFTELSADEAKRRRDAIAPVAKQWVDDLQAKGLPGKQVYDSWVAATAKK